MPPEDGEFWLRLLPARPRQQFPAAIRAPALHGRTAIGAERAFVGTDTGGGAICRKGRGATLALRFHFECHGIAPQRVCRSAFFARGPISFVSANRYLGRNKGASHG
jgi:hypothetical protein